MLPKIYRATYLWVILHEGGGVALGERLPVSGQPTADSTSEVPVAVQIA